MTARDVDARMRRDRRLAEVDDQLARAQRLRHTPAYADRMRDYIDILTRERELLLRRGARRPY